VPEVVEGKKKCRVCDVDIEETEYVGHVKQHQKECLVHLLDPASKNFLKKHDGLVVRSALPLIEEHRLSSEAKQVRLDTVALLALLNTDYEKQRHVLYTQKGRRINEGISYHIPTGPQKVALVLKSQTEEPQPSASNSSSN